LLPAHAGQAQAAMKKIVKSGPASTELIELTEMADASDTW
jgi:hypothetical protein